jgi:hypothetical protein
MSKYQFSILMTAIWISPLGPSWVNIVGGLLYVMISFINYRNSK